MFPSAQDSSGARTSVECSAEQRQVSNFLNISDTTLYAISEEELSDKECTVPDPENNEDEIRLLWNPIDKDTSGRGGRCVSRGHFSETAS